MTDRDSQDCEVLISYPGLKNEISFYYLINLNPQIPSNYSDFKKTYHFDFDTPLLVHVHTN